MVKINLKPILFYFFILFVINNTYSQKQLSGSITSEDGPLPGATVIVQGTNNGTTSDFDGNFTINANEGDILQISFVGFQSQEITVTNENSYSITMISDNELEEVVLTGYGH